MSSFEFHLSGADVREDDVIVLRDELSAVRGVTVDRLEEAPAVGSKAGGISLLGVLVTAGAESIPNVIAAIAQWFTRQPPSTTIRVKDGDFEFEWTGGTPPEKIEKLALRIASRRVS